MHAFVGLSLDVVCRRALRSKHYSMIWRWWSGLGDLSIV